MEIPFAEWNAAIPRRTSRRRFDSAQLESSLLARMRTVCREFRPFPQARAELVTHSIDSILKGAVGSYGKVKGAPAVIAFVGDMRAPHVQEKVGYMGEGIILEATALGLGTCWVGGFFRREVTESILGIGANERALAVTPVGYATEEHSREEKTMKRFARSHRRKPLAELVDGLGPEEWPRWMVSALEAARIAPSAVNRQPWRFLVEPDSVTVSVDNPWFDFGISKRLDCGIAMLHIEVAALDSGVHGGWQFLQAPQVARFTARGVA